MACGHDLTAALALLRAVEGCRARPYRCPAGLSTIGYGHVVRDQLGAPVSLAEAERLYAGPLSPREAETLLRADVADAAARVDALLRVPLADHQFCALVSFAFNVGIGALGRSTLLRRVNANMLGAVPSELRRWIYADGRVIEGLRMRREAEIALWQGRATAPGGSDG